MADVPIYVLEANSFSRSSVGFSTPVVGVSPTVSAIVYYVVVKYSSFSFTCVGVYGAEMSSSVSIIV